MSYANGTATIDSVGPHEPIVSDKRGYFTSVVPYRMDLMPAAALLRLSKIMCEGAKSHGENNWKRGSVADHLNKALVHAYAHLAGDTSDDHLGHAAWRFMAALEISLQGETIDSASTNGGCVQGRGLDCSTV